jgi:hypothetical protein
MTEQRRCYVAYLLRLWQVRAENGMAWRASLESARTGERVGFASLEELFGFLEKAVCQVAEDQITPTTGATGGDVDD